MTVKERIRIYIRYKNISQRAFCTTIGVSSAFISGMRKSLQPDKIQSIIEHFPDLNTTWLLTGEGTMILSPKKRKQLSAPADYNTELQYFKDQLKAKEKEIIKLKIEIQKLQSSISNLKSNNKKNSQ